MENKTQNKPAEEVKTCKIFGLEPLTMVKRLGKIKDRERALGLIKKTFEKQLGAAEDNRIFIETGLFEKEGITLKKFINTTDPKELFPHLVDECKIMVDEQLTSSVERDRAKRYLDVFIIKSESLNPEQTTGAQNLNPEPEQAASTIPTINDTDKEKLVFGNALKKQYMSLSDGCYRWTLAKSLLAYMCGRLYCGDRIKEDNTDYSKEYIKGKSQMPAQGVKALFGVDVASNRYSIKAPPRSSWKVDELFKSNGASK